MLLRRCLSTTTAVVLATAIGFGAGSAGAAPQSAPDGPATGKVVKIGVLAPLDAGLVEFGEGIRNSVQVAVDQANKRRTIPGYTIELTAVNDSSDGPTGAASAATLVADPEVIGVVGPYNSGVAQAALPVLAPAHLALVSPGNTLADLTLGPDAANPVRPYDSYFRVVASDADQAPFLAKSAKELGAKKIAIVSETKAVSKGLADAFATAFEDGGGTVSAQEVVPDGNTDFTNFLSEALPDNPDMIFFGGEYPVAAELRGQATQAGYKKPLMGGDGIKDPAFITDAGPAAKGSFASSVGSPAASLKTAKAFLAAYKKARFDAPSTDFGPYAYDAANIVIAAAKKVLAGQDAIPADAREQVVAAIQATKTDGASGPVGFDQYGDTTHRVFTLYRVSGPKGKLAFVPFTP
jgi:branched-chain amino acid transport system substrate-binding protein